MMCKNKNHPDTNLCCTIQPKHQCHTCRKKFCNKCVTAEVVINTDGWNLRTTNSDGHVQWLDLDFMSGISKTNKGD